MKHDRNIKARQRVRPFLNVAEIGRRMNITQQYVGQLLSGKRNSEKRLRQIRKMLQHAFREYLENPE